MNEILEQYIDVEVERYVNNVVSKAIRERIAVLAEEGYMNMNNRYGFNGINSISYDTVRINYIKKSLEETALQEIMKIENGELDDYFIPLRTRKGRLKRIRNAVLCDISIGSTRNSSLFANIGPTIPIKLIFNGQINSELEVNQKEYGINNVIVEMDIKISIKEQAIMPISSRTKTIVLREPLSIDIINGKIPDYYGGYIK